jgi:Ti-type conjugative transfer relaxase TraA
MIPRLKVGSGVTGAVRYALGEGRDPFTNEVRKKPANDRSRVEWIGGINVGFPIETHEDANLARRIMEFDSLNQTSPTRRCVKDCVHLALAWRPGEQPTREQMEEAALGALKALGMENAKAIFVAHNDEQYAHVHIVASKLNPATERAYDLKQSYVKLSRWAEQYERDHNGGIICIRREEANKLRDAIDKRDAGAVLENMTEHRATFTLRDLDRVLAKQIPRELERAQFTETILKRPEAVRLSGGDSERVRYSTKTVLEAEQYVLRAADGLAQIKQHQVGERVLSSILSHKYFDGISREQALAVRHVTGPEGLALIDGQAGTGKSYTVTAVRAVYEVQGYKVIGLAPTNAVAQDMQRDGFTRAGTVHSELFSLNNERTKWDKKTVVIVDEAAMIDTRNMAMLTAHAYNVGAKLILVGDDRQLSSIERGGMFAVLAGRHGAAALAEVRRQHKNDDRRAAELMAEGNFHEALSRYSDKGAIHWTRTQDEARLMLVRTWASDNAADPSKARFVFAYTNADVDQLNRDIREVRKQAGQLGAQDHRFDTSHGRAQFSEGDRLQFTATVKPRGIYNGQAGVVLKIDQSRFTVRLDGRKGQIVEFDAKEFPDFRHGYAGTIYKGQGRTLDQTYLYHTEHWRSATAYVALTRHREKVELFVAKNTAPDLKQLSRQMTRIDDRRAASHFNADKMTPVRPLTPRELAARLNTHPVSGRPARHELARQQQDESDKRQQPAIEPAAKAERRARGDTTPGTGRSETDRRLERLLNTLEDQDRKVSRTDARPGGRTRTR